MMSIPFDSIGADNGFQDQRVPLRRKSKRRPASSSSRRPVPPNYYDTFADSPSSPQPEYGNWMMPPRVDSSNDDIDLYMDALNLRSTTTDSTLYDEYQYSPAISSSSSSAYRHPHKPVIMDPIVYDDDLYQDTVFEEQPYLMSRQHSSFSDQPPYHYLPVPAGLNAGVPPFADDHMMNMMMYTDNEANQLAYDDDTHPDSEQLNRRRAQYYYDNGPSIDGNADDWGYSSLLRPDPARLSRRRGGGSKRRQKRPSLQRSHSIGTTADIQYHEGMPVPDTYYYEWRPEQQEPFYHHQSNSAPNSPRNHRRDDPEDEDMMHHPDRSGLRRSNSMQGPLLAQLPAPHTVLMNDTPLLQRRHSFFDSGHQQGSPEFPTAGNSTHGTPWLSNMDRQQQPSSHASSGMLAVSMPGSSESSSAPPTAVSTPPATVAMLTPPGNFHPSVSGHAFSQHQEQQQQRHQSLANGTYRELNPQLQLPFNALSFQSNNNGFLPASQQLSNPMMNAAMQQHSGMNMPLPTPTMGMLPGTMVNHLNIPRYGISHWNNGMNAWDPLMMDPGMGIGNRMMGPRPPPFGYSGGPMMMNPMMGGPLGMTSPPFLEDQNNGNSKKGKEDKKSSKEKDKTGDATKGTPAATSNGKGSDTNSTEPTSLASAAAASAATTTPAAAASAEEQLPPLNQGAVTSGAATGSGGALVRSMGGHEGNGLRRKSSIWNLFGMGGGNNRSQSTMMNPYAIPGRHMLPYMAPPEMMMNDLHHSEHPKLVEMVEKFQNLMYVWCYVTPMENFQTAWCTFKIQNQRKLNHAERHRQRTVTLEKEKNLPGTVIVNPLSKTAVMYKSLWSTTKMIITIMRLSQEEYRRQQHALSPELMRRWGSKRSQGDGYASSVLNSMFRDYAR